MRRRLCICVAVTLIGAAAVCWFRFQQRARSHQAGAFPETSTVAQSPPPLTVISGNVQIDTASLNPEQVRAEVRRRDSQDSKWEWKVPIRFYGKTIDESGRPVAEADVHFQWTDLSSKGTGDSRTTTDGQGLFSLDNVNGKRLVVRVNKSGYYSSDSRNRFSFEYANPFEEIFYRPKAEAPILFYLRRRNPADNVIHKSVELVLPGDGSATKLDLQSGMPNVAGALQLQAWKPWPPRPMTPPYDWKVMISMSNGGFVETREDFAFEAPEIGYEETYVIDMSAALGNLWKVAAERSLYFTFGEPKRYGHLTLRTDGNSRFVFLNYVINHSGSRNLENGNESP
jgi:Carboxypeptidase regulatory-like domain